MEDGDDVRKHLIYGSSSFSAMREEFQEEQQGGPNHGEHIPIKYVCRVMHRALPPHTKITEDAKRSMQILVSEYVNFISIKAHERSRSYSRDIIILEDILNAMKHFSFDKYARVKIEEGNAYANDTGALQVLQQAPTPNNTPSMLPPMVNAPTSGCYPRLGVGCFSSEAINNFSKGNPSTTSIIFDVNSSSSTSDPIELEELIEGPDPSSLL